MKKELTLTRNPQVIITAIILVVEAALALAVLFGLDLTTEQMAGFMGLLGATGALVGTLLIRPKVTPMAAPRTRSGEPATIQPLHETQIKE